MSVLYSDTDVMRGEGACHAQRAIAIRTSPLSGKMHAVPNADWWPSEGDEPDPRWSLANERTLLAYSRTALGLVVAGLAIAGSHSVADLPLWVALLGFPAIALGAAVAIAGRRRFLDTQRAMRLGEPLPAPLLAALLPLGIGLFAVAGFAVVAIELATN